MPSLALPPNYKSIPVPDAPAISQALQLARSLRPLARQIEIGLPTLLDEVATVDLIAETGLWQPVLKPESELWLDVALVFDTSPSMCLWQRLGVDLYRLLSRYGEFRDVRVWLLQPTATGKVNLTSRNGTVHKPSELLTGDRRRLVVIVSDCVAPAWHNGTMRTLIAIWSAKLHTVVFQVFPERLWARTALVRSVTVELQAKQPSLPSDRLQPVTRSVWDRERLQRSLRATPVRLPIVPVEPKALASWAKVVAGDRHARSLGIVWDAQPVTLSAPQPPVAPSPSDLKEQIDSFLLLSSPTTRRLAELLASAPVITLPIARLIKQAMLPHEATAVHMAEVFMSGLLKVSGAQTPSFENAERIAYELVDETVRDRLRSGSLKVDALTVLEKVSSYVAQGLGKSVSEFRALLRAPTRGEGTAETAFLNAFAVVTAKVLRGLGSDFEAIANSFVSPSLESSGTESSHDFPLEDLEYEVAKLVNFPPLQACEYQSATITAILDRFDFETAKLERENRWLGLRQEWIIRRRQAVVWGYTELLSPASETADPIPLEMIAIPSGSFTMGAPESESESRDDERPQHEVTLQPFYLGRYPVTQAQWSVVAGYERVDRDLDPDPSNFKGANRPVESVSWEDAQEFCQRLSVATGKDYRLPSEAQWEYACRAGTETPFHFGETISPELANYEGRSTYGDGSKGEFRQETTEVGSFPANDWGLHDMHGNVWEWCEDDWHSNYNGAPEDGSVWVESNREETGIVN